MAKNVVKSRPLIIRLQLLRKGKLLTVDQVDRVYLDVLDAATGNRTITDIPAAEAMGPVQPWEKDNIGYNFSWAFPPAQKGGTTFYTFTIFSDGIASRTTFKINHEII